MEKLAATTESKKIKYGKTAAATPDIVLITGTSSVYPGVSAHYLTK